MKHCLSSCAPKEEEIIKESDRTKWHIYNNQHTNIKMQQKNAKERSAEKNIGSA